MLSSARGQAYKSWEAGKSFRFGGVGWIKVLAIAPCPRSSIRVDFPPFPDLPPFVTYVSPLLLRLPFTESRIAERGTIESYSLISSPLRASALPLRNLNTLNIYTNYICKNLPSMRPKFIFKKVWNWKSNIKLILCEIHAHWKHRIFQCVLFAILPRRKINSNIHIWLCIY